MLDEKIKKMFDEAAELHDVVVNQKYGEDNLPYSAHLGDVLLLALEYSKDIPEFEKNIYIIAFGACFHDAIEDARETYNDILKRARTYFEDKDEAVMATEIVYALTNEKGRNRDERANDKYYEGIRNTAFASFVKCCDRMANYTYAKRTGSSMAKRYRKEMPDFIMHVVYGTPKYVQYSVPERLLTDLSKNI